jgi:LysM repeat protein
MPESRNTFAGGKVIGVPTALSKGFKSPRREPASSAGPPRRRGFVQLYAPEVAISVMARYIAPPQVISERAASGAWTTIQRMKRRPLSSWTGPQLVRIECQLRFGGDGLGPVTDDLEQLRRLQNRLPGDDAADRPPFIRVVGYVPGHYDRVEWQIDGLEIAEEGFKAGKCVLASAKVTLVEWVSSTITTKAPPARRPARKVKWKKGDTLPKLAKKYLGSDSKQARSALRKANPGIKAWTKIEVGRTITIPASTTVSK